MLQQNLVQKQETKILPQQIQLLNLFHLNTIELEHRIEQELEDNPFLEKKEEEEDAAGDKLAKEQVDRANRRRQQAISGYSKAS